MQDFGPQYSKDILTDPTGFLKRARMHQSKFRAITLCAPFDTYGNYLTKEDGEKGKNFYPGFGIFEAVKRYRRYNKNLYSNMLRSEHIPFNFFIPLCQDKNLFKNVFNEFFNNGILSVDRIEIEYAPKPKEKYLNDATSFDAYIEYTHIDNSKGSIGIEVKYTEKEYGLNRNSKQEKAISDKASKYYFVTNSCKIYKSDALGILPSDKFRQIWRNHIFGESILLADSSKFKHFTSVILFPIGNTHFVNTSKEYISLLKVSNNKFLALTFEEFFEGLIKHSPSPNYTEWIDYLKSRYIVI